MKRSLKILTLVAAMLLTAQTASATTIQDILDGGGSLTVGNLMFSDFQVDSTAMNAPAIDASLIQINSSTAGGQVTLDFASGGWLATALGGNVALTDSHIRFQVTAINGYVVDGVGLAATSWNTQGDGQASIIENIYPGTDPSNPELGSMTVARNSGGIQNNQGCLFAPGQTQLWIEKNVTLVAMDGPGMLDMAQIGGFTQTFETTPEPGTCLLLGLGGLAMLYNRKRRPQLASC